MDEKAMENTDRELFREVEGDYYAPSLHVTDDGAIGINVGGSVVVLPLREWHRLALSRPQAGGGDGVLAPEFREEVWTAVHSATVTGSAEDVTAATVRICEAVFRLTTTPSVGAVRAAAFEEAAGVADKALAGWNREICSQRVKNDPEGGVGWKP